MRMISNASSVTMPVNNSQEIVQETGSLDKKVDPNTPILIPGSLKNVSERILKAKVKLLESPHDLDAWSILIKDVQGRNIEAAREVYEMLVDRFPTSGRFWKLYIDHEIKGKNYEKVEKLFQKCLVKVLNIDLWKCYLSYIKEAKSNLQSFREKMGQAFDFALEKMGIDINSYSIYNDYVNFLKGVDAQGNYAENQKISAVRRVYQRGIVIPMLNIEVFWKDYLAYEQSINQMFVDKAIADRSKDYMNARRVAKELEVVTRGLNRNAPAVPPKSTVDEVRQVELWKKYIQWEKSNPLKTEDHSLLIKRVVYAYEQSLLCLGHHPDIWYEYASYLNENSKFMAEKGDMNHYRTLQDDVASVYERATNTLLKENILLHFSYADFEESRNRKEEAIKIYEKLLNIKTLGFDPTLIYIQYLKFTRRTESIISARAIFKRAREDSRCGHEVYTAAALMEYYCSKDKNIACKIFELGLKKFPHEANFVLSYIDFLSHLNEENNIRVLFERVLSSDAIPYDKSIDIWNRFLEFESQIGDLAGVMKVEKRRALVIEKLQKSYSETPWLVDRYKFFQLMPCNERELRSIGYFNKLPSSDSSQNSENCSGCITADSKPSLPMPNLTQMVPFKPTQNPVNNLLPGGIFPYPPSMVSLLSQLPPPMSFRGPFVNIDELLSTFNACNSIALNEGNKGECLLPIDAKSYFSLAVETVESLNSNSNAKRPLVLDDEDEIEGDNSLPPQFDVYRSRQMQKKPRI